MLKNFSPAFGTIWGCDRNFKGWSLPRGSRSWPWKLYLWSEPFSLLLCWVTITLPWAQKTWKQLTMDRNFWYHGPNRSFLLYVLLCLWLPNYQHVELCLCASLHLLSICCYFLKISSTFDGKSRIKKIIDICSSVLSATVINTMIKSICSSEGRRGQRKCLFGLHSPGCNPSLI